MLKRKLNLMLIILSLIINICRGEFIKISQQPANILEDFFGYRHVSIIHFNVPENVITAAFKFTAKETKTGGLGNCSPRDVSVYLKSGSIPLVHPDGSKISAELLKNRRKFYHSNFTSSGDHYSILIPSPSAGDWYAIAFRSWTDPDSEKITQQGIGTACNTVLDAELSVERVGQSVFMKSNDENTITLSSNLLDTAMVQFFVPGDQQTINISLISSCEECRVAANVITKETLKGALINQNETTLEFKPYVNSFHYLTLRLLSGNATNISIALPVDNLSLSDDIFDIDNYDTVAVNKVPLTRRSLPDFFLFDYEHLLGNSSKPSPVNITVDSLTVLSYQVAPVYDVGGTVSIGIKLVKKSDDIVVVGCVSLGYYAGITAGGGCMKQNSLTAADLWSNSTKPTIIHIPYPEPGTWHLSMKAFYIEPKCNCSVECRTSGCKLCDCMNETSTRVETNIASSPCIEGHCNSNGRCLHYMTGGSVFSACYCNGGYRGFDCADDTYVLTGGSILIRLLLLTLSNLAFLASSYVAFRREYYTEALVYVSVMFFSTFYHACEAGENIMSFCITKLSVLQFCDFYNALLSIWVTLVAMASFGPRLTAFCQISGAIVLALGAELDRTALWVFLLPAVTGSILIGVSWGLRCRRQRNFCYPASRYRNVYLPTGLGLVSVGLICYAFLQTRRNYHIIHSFWHVCIALSVVLLLPKRKHMK
ncbi:transmembrane protein 8B [Microplitis mediator]|uniref:transmembrane protein 8B n=1 Tax=Microplitis mediator TaxID=375433 RepID=UPI0025575E28|nr:transmembrane protein 8B [Microplitis mediator]